MRKLLEKSKTQVAAGLDQVDRDSIRKEIRALRDGWENHIDYMNLVHKKVEVIILQWSSFDDSFMQTQKWFESISGQEASPRIQEYNTNSLPMNSKDLNPFRTKVFLSLFQNLPKKMARRKMKA